MTPVVSNFQFWMKWRLRIDAPLQVALWRTRPFYTLHLR